MKENISIIFAAIIGTFLIVILPLYSILDRQDSMSYNVVLTETTKFVDNVRNNGFIDRQSYYDYLAALESTSNTYKVTIEAYRNTLIRETDENGNIIPDSYIEQKELYNTQDILKVLENETVMNGVDGDKTNIKNSAYLLNENDEFYVRVYNTNVTAGSILYSLIAGITNNKVVNISFGGVVNNVNWELYEKMQSEVLLVPEVIMSVPVNLKNSTNIKRIDDVQQEHYIECDPEYLEEYGTEELIAACEDLTKSTYSYIYDLTNTDNKTIRVAVELRRFATIDIGTVLTGNTDTYAPMAQIDMTWFANSGVNASNIEKYIINNYIKLDGMYANIDLQMRQAGDYYVFDIVLTNVSMAALDYISSKAKILISPALGEDASGISSLGAESVEIELIDETLASGVSISAPHIWNKLIKTKSLIESRISDKIVYTGVDIAFLISYTGINGHDTAEILSAIQDNMKVYATEATYSNLEYYTAEELKDEYNIDISTQLVNRILVKFKYTTSNTNRFNYIKLLDGWIDTNVDNVINAETGEMVMFPADGAQSTEYEVLTDNVAPLAPTLSLSGTKGNGDWYTSEVVINMLPPSSDLVRRNGTIKAGGSGIAKTTIALNGATQEDEVERAKTILNQEGITTAVGRTYDYSGNVSTATVNQIKVDTEGPTAPVITLTGNVGENGWYTDDITMNITPGVDNTSGVLKTTYRIEGANSIQETEGLTYTFRSEGQSTVIATTYDKAGNKTETKAEVNLDKTIPPDAIITVISGEKNSPDSTWYYTDVTLRVKVDDGNSQSGLGKTSYKVTSDGREIIPLTEFSGTTRDITITENGVHTLTVYTFTIAGKVKTTTYDVKIDKTLPRPPKITVLTGTEGENNWYTSNVRVQVSANGDSSAHLRYTITKSGVTSTQTEIAEGATLSFNEEGEHILTLYAEDEALNIEQVQQVIKIDKTAPTPAEFVITGTEGRDGWYISNVNLSYIGEQDNISGIQRVMLSTNKITQNTHGTLVTLTTKDNAGHTVTREVTIKMDKIKPTKPLITIEQQSTGSDSLFGGLLYNTDISVAIIPGEDEFLPNVTTTYELKDAKGNNVIISETEGTTLEINQEGSFTIIARTKDIAGNVAEETQTVWIDKSVPNRPKILSINGTDVTNNVIHTEVSNSNKLTLEIDNLTSGNSIKILLSTENYEEIEEIFTATRTGVNTFEITLSKKGTYNIIVTQTNMFGTESKDSTGTYYYTYE